MSESSSSRLLPDASPLPDEERRLGRYRLLRPIASGGMATVHLATVEGHEGFSKLVALKVIHDHLARDASFVDMFLDEARIAARIEHANVCSVFDFGECDGTYFIAMEYLLGETFGGVRDVVRKLPYPVDWPVIVASLMVQACEGLHAAHNLLGPDGAPLGLVHRDVSPQNLFVTYGGTVKVVDFGIARAAGRSHQTAPGTLKGKFAYMAPEQISAAEGTDRRSDVWALGVTMWELLVQKPLFRQAGPAETLNAVMTRVVDAPSSRQPLVPSDLDAIVLKALTRDPSARYASAREFGRDLAAFCRRHGGLRGPVEIEEWLDANVPGAREQPLVTTSREFTMTRAKAERALVPLPVPKGATAAYSVVIPAHEPEPRRRSFVPALALGALCTALGAGGVFVHHQSVELAEATARIARQERVGADMRLDGDSAGSRRDTTAGSDARAEGSGSSTTARTIGAEGRDPRGTSEADVRLGADAVGMARPSTARSATMHASIQEHTVSSAHTANSSGSSADSATLRESTFDPAVAPSGRGPTSAPSATTITNGSSGATTASAIAAAAAGSPNERAAASAPSTQAPESVQTPQTARAATTAAGTSTTSPPSPPSAPSFDATVGVRALTVQGALPATSVRSAIGRVGARMRTCYQSSARAAGRDAAADVGVRFAIDETGGLRNVSTDGPSALAGCVREAVARLRTRDRPDMGFVQVTFTVHFAPIVAER